MAWSNLNHICRLSVLGEDSGQAVNNVFHAKLFSGGGEITPVPLASLLSTFAGRWAAWVIPNAPVSYNVKAYAAVLIEGSVVNPTPPPTPVPPWYTPNVLLYGEQAVLVPTTDRVGTKIGDPLPTFNAMSVRWITLIRARHYRGGSRLRVGVEANTTGNDWDVGFGEAWSDIDSTAGAFYADLVNPGDWGSTTVRLSVFAQTTFLRTGLGTSTPAELTQPIIAHVVNPKVSSQVSRKDRARLA